MAAVLSLIDFESAATLSSESLVPQQAVPRAPRHTVLVAGAVARLVGRADWGAELASRCGRAFVDPISRPAVLFTILTVRQGVSTSTLFDPFGSFAVLGFLSAFWWSTR